MLFRTFIESQIKFEKVNYIKESDNKVEPIHTNINEFVLEF